MRTLSQLAPLQRQLSPEFLFIISVCCIIFALLVGGYIYLRRRRLKRIREHSKIATVELDMATCAFMPNGNVVIRPLRGKTLFIALVVGLPLTLLGLGRLVLLSDRTQTPFEQIETIGLSIGLLLLGIIALRLSKRALSATDIVIDTASHTVTRHGGWWRPAQTWSLDSVIGIVSQPVVTGHLRALEDLSFPFIADRVSISLQFGDGQLLHIGTAGKPASVEILHLLPAAIGKPLEQREK